MFNPRAFRIAVSGVRDRTIWAKVKHIDFEFLYICYLPVGRSVSRKTVPEGTIGTLRNKDGNADDDGKEQ